MSHTGIGTIDTCSNKLRSTARGSITSKTSTSSKFRRNTLTVITGLMRVRQVARWRSIRFTRRDSGATPGNAVALCPAVSRSDGTAGSGFDRRAESGDFDRTEDHQPQSCGRPCGTITEIYDYLRGVVRGVSACRIAPLAGWRFLRQSAQQILQQVMTLGPAGTRDDPRADRAWAQRRVPQGTGKAGAPGIRCGPALTACCGRSMRRLRSTNARITPSKWWWTAC